MERDINILGIADPGLFRNDQVQLTWYTGPRDLDYHPILAESIKAAAILTNSQHILLVGSSGGGFAALQVAPLLKNSVAVVFNPQTAIWRYLLPNGQVWSQRSFVRTMAPELLDSAEERFGREDWTVSFGDRLNAVRRYQTVSTQRVVYSTNIQDLHHHREHFVPFQDAMSGSGLLDYLKVISYAGGATHRPPTPERFLEAIDLATIYAQEDCE